MTKPYDDWDEQHRKADADLVRGLATEGIDAVYRVARWLDEESRLRDEFAAGFGQSAGVFARKLRKLMEGIE